MCELLRSMVEVWLISFLQVSATGQGSQVNFPCSTCKVPRDSLTNVRRPFPPRTIDCIRELVESSNEKELHDHHSAFALKVVHIFKIYILSPLNVLTKLMVVLLVCFLGIQI